MSRFNVQISKDRCRETGVVLSFLLFVSDWIWAWDDAYTALGIALTITLFIPMLWKPLAYLLFTSGALLGGISTKVILSIVYLVLVCPMGYLRRWVGKDEWRLGQFKQSRASVLEKVDYTYSKNDLDQQF